jgi:hypothetical protein
MAIGNSMGDSADGATVIYPLPEVDREVLPIV